MLHSTDIFAPEHYRHVRRPLLEAETLPVWCYTSPEFFSRELEMIFKRTWAFVGREDELANPGDYLAMEMFGEPLIVLRDKQGALRAFANTCRHRGTVLLQGKGNCRAIRCPYHSWTYALTGELISAPGMRKTVGFDPAENGLIPVRLETWEGFVFVNFRDEAEPLLEYLGDLPDRFEPYRFRDMLCVRRKEYDLACNWKIYIENAMEEYHTPTVHNKSIGSQKTTREDTKGQWDAIHMPCERTIAVLPNEDTPFPAIPSLRGKAAEGTYFTVIYPSTFFATTFDCMWWLQLFPLAADRTRVVIGSCFPRETVTRPDFDTVVQKYYRRWDAALPEDNDISEKQQAGLASSRSRPGRFSIKEPVVHAIDNWVVDRILGDVERA
jgi:choline monooxygenase